MKTIFIFLIFLTATLRSQWIKQIIPDDVYGLTCIDFYDQNTGVAGGWKFSTDFIGRVIYTTNSGVNWIISVIPDSVRLIYKVQLINQSTGFIAGVYKTNLNCYRGMFLRTTNGGQIWFNFGTLPPNIFNLVGMKCINATTVFALSRLDPNMGNNRQSILKSTNGGLSWSTMLTLDSVNLISINNSDINNIYACGTYFNIGFPQGIILMSTDGGINWTRQNFSNVMQFRDINFATFNTGFAVGGPASNGMIYRTTDSGFNWAISTILPLNTNLNGIEFVIGTGKGIAVGSEDVSYSRSLIYRTTNYGSNWTSYSLPDTNALSGQALTDLHTWFVCGGTQEATIYKSTNGGEIGIQKISNYVPDKFELYQNYPNPFNPISKIKFQISKLTEAKIIIFDALGREIQILVNEKLSPGTYETEFDGSNCPSGVYYYRFTTGAYSETKKMILIK